MSADLFLRRLQRSRLRQLAIATSTAGAACIFITCFKASEVGGFAFYSITLLLLINAVLALMQYQQVIRPIEELLRHLIDISGHITANDFSHVGRISSREGDAFGCLAAGVDSVIESLLERVTSLTDLNRDQSDLLMALPVSILLLTHDGKVAKMLNASGMGEALKGFRIGEKPLESYWGRENAAMLRDTLAKALKGTDALWRDVSVARAGVAAESRYRLSLRRLNNMSVMMTVLDVTDSRFATAEGRADTPSSTATQKRAAIRRMAASIAHDGKNVFAALNNLVEINKGSTDPNVRAQIPMAEDAIRRGTNLMQELTAFAGEMRLSLKCVSAAESLRSILETPALKALLPKNVQLIPSISDKPMPEIDLDADQAWKVACNLVKNAVEAMRGNDGRIWVKVEPCTMSQDQSATFRHTGTLRTGKGVLVSFTDDGPGMAAETSEKIFDPYFSSKGDGRGIGLSTVMAIVDAHGGAINVKSSPGYGTTFYIYLPASRNTTEELKLIHEIAPNGEILLIDDDPTILHTTSLVLRSLKIAAHPASNEEDAIAKLRSLRGRTKAVLVDGNIGCVSSAGLVQRIHGEFPGLPVIIVSGSPKETIDDRFAGVPYDRFLSKPYSVAELSAALNEISHQA